MVGDGQVKALEAMVAYLKDHFQDQLSSFREVKNKVAVLLTIYAGLLGLVSFSLPALARAQTTGPGWLRGTACLAVCAFGLSLARTLWLAVHVMDVVVALPAVQPGVFEAVARAQVDVKVVLGELVNNYASAITRNHQLIAERNEPGKKFVFWSKATLGAAFVAVGLLGAVYLQSTAGTEGARSSLSREAGDAVVTEPTMSDPKSTSTTTDAQASPPSADKTPVAPSLIGKPQEIGLGRSYEPTARPAAPPQGQPAVQKDGGTK